MVSALCGLAHRARLTCAALLQGPHASFGAAHEALPRTCLLALEAHCSGYASPEIGGASRAFAPGVVTGFLQRGCASSGCPPAHALCWRSRSNSLDILRTSCYCRKGAGPTYAPSEGKHAPR